MNNTSPLKVSSNLLLVDYGLREYRDTHAFISSHLSIYSSKHGVDPPLELFNVIDHLSAASFVSDDAVLLFNLACGTYHLQLYPTTVTILEFLLRNIDTADEVVDPQVKIRVAFLLLETYINLYRANINGNGNEDQLSEFNGLCADVLKFLDGPHAFNGGLGGKGGGEGDGDAPAPSSADMIEFRYRLRLYKSKLRLVQGDFKVGKKEIKAAMEIFNKEMKEKAASSSLSPSTTEGNGGGGGGGSDDEDEAMEDESIMNEAISMGRSSWWELGGRNYNTSGLFLKAHFEFLKSNYKKSVTLLNACFQNDIAESLYYNSMGCIHYRKESFKLATFYFGKALAAQNFTVQVNNGRIILPWRYEILHNNGLTLMKAGEYALAFKCFFNCIAQFGKRPMFWLKLAECCIHHHAKESKAGEGKLIKNVVQGPGDKQNLLLLPLSRGGSTTHAATTSKDIHPNCNLEFAYTSLKNVMFLISGVTRGVSVSPKKGKDSKDSKGGGARRDGERVGDNTGPLRFNTLKTSKIESLRIHALLDTAYVAINLNHPLAAVQACKQLLSLPSCPEKLKLYVKLYIAEALCMLNRPSEAMEYLSPPEGDVSIDETSQAGFLVNLAVVHVLLMKDAVRAELLARQALARKPGMLEAVKLLVYLLLLKGDYATAIYMLRSRDAPPH
jgi:tetratricopeptide (TPR) repeat protein